MKDALSWATLLSMVNKLKKYIKVRHLVESMIKSLMPRGVLFCLV